MSNATTTRTVDRATYLAPTRADLLADGLRCIVAGRPLPEALRPAPVALPAAATVHEGIARILAGPAVRATAA